MFYNIRIYGYHVFSDIRADQRRPGSAGRTAAPPPPAALATGTALSVLHAWTLYTPRGNPASCLAPTQYQWHTDRPGAGPAKAAAASAELEKFENT